MPTTRRKPKAPRLQALRIDDDSVGRSKRCGCNMICSTRDGRNDIARACGRSRVRSPNQMPAPSKSRVARDACRWCLLHGVLYMNGRLWRRHAQQIPTQQQTSRYLDTAVGSVPHRPAPAAAYSPSAECIGPAPWRRRAPLSSESTSRPGRNRYAIAAFPWAGSALAMQLHISQDAQINRREPTGATARDVSRDCVEQRLCIYR